MKKPPKVRGVPSSASFIKMNSQIILSFFSPPFWEHRKQILSFSPFCLAPSQASEAYIENDSDLTEEFRFNNWHRQSISSSVGGTPNPSFLVL